VSESRQNSPSASAAFEACGCRCWGLPCAPSRPRMCRFEVGVATLHFIEAHWQSLAVAHTPSSFFDGPGSNYLSREQMSKSGFRTIAVGRKSRERRLTGAFCTRSGDLIPGRRVERKLSSWCADPHSTRQAACAGSLHRELFWLACPRQGSNP
jgi:hypothetical protein